MAPSQESRSASVYQFEVIIQDEIRDYHLRRHRSIEPARTENVRVRDGHRTVVDCQTHQAVLGPPQIGNFKLGLEKRADGSCRSTELTDRKPLNVNGSS